MNKKMHAIIIDISNSVIFHIIDGRITGLKHFTNNKIIVTYIRSEQLGSLTSKPHISKASISTLMVESGNLVRFTGAHMVMVLLNTSSICYRITELPLMKKGHDFVLGIP
jgi:hypothetical protein